MARPRVTFINHDARNCGVHEFGKHTYRHIQASRLVDFAYSEVTSETQLRDALRGSSMAIVNFHPATMPWLQRPLVRGIDLPIAGVVHEFDYLNCFQAQSDIFDYRILPDPTVEARLPNVFVTPFTVNRTFRFNVPAMKRIFEFICENNRDYRPLFGPQGASPAR